MVSRTAVLALFVWAADWFGESLAAKAWAAQAAPRWVFVLVVTVAEGLLVLATTLPAAPVAYNCLLGTQGVITLAVLIVVAVQEWSAGREPVGV